MAKLIDEKLKYELWNLLTWVGTLKIRLEGVECSDYCKELYLINERANFIANFEIDDIDSIRKLNDICCNWANYGIDIQPEGWY